MASDFVILVDENDHQIGMMEKMEAHRKALLHRAISVFIVNSKGEWLLQQRAMNKYHSKGLWTNTCCSHPYPNELTIDAAHRRLKEEMGLKCDLTEIFHFIYHEKLDNNLSEHELDHVLIGFTNENPIINNDEVMDFKWFDYECLNKNISQSPDLYTVWFKNIFKRVKDHI